MRALKDRFPQSADRSMKVPCVARVFLSYARPDMKLARKIARLFWQRGIEVDMYNPRDPWEDPLREMYLRIPGKDCVVWLSNGRTPSDWIAPELERAAEQSVPVLNLGSIAELRSVSKAIKEGDWRGDIAAQFLRDDLPELEGGLESEKNHMEKLFDRQVDAGEGSEYIGRLAWFGREEEDENAKRALLFAALVIMPWGCSLVLLMLAGLSMLFWAEVAKWFFLCALACCLVGVGAWRWVSRRARFVTYRNHVGRF